MYEIIGIEDIHSLNRIIQKQKEKMVKLRKIVKELKFIPIDPVGNYTCITYKAIDGGKMKIEFDPYEMDLITIADSNGREILKFATPKGKIWDLTSNDFLELDEIPQIKKFVNVLGEDSVVNISTILTEAKTAMQIAEYACIFERITADFVDPTIIMKDGFLRTKEIKASLIPKLILRLKENKDMKLVGVSKTSKLLSMISSALFIEKIFPPDGVGYVEVPSKLELMAYKWSGHGEIKDEKKLDYAFGKLYVAKLSNHSNLLTTVEIPYDFKDDKLLYSKQEINEIFGHLIKDSMYSYPNLGYPQTIMRAHEKAVQIGFTASIIKDKIMDKLIDNTDKDLKDYIRDHRIRKEIVDKGVLGGGM